MYFQESMSSAGTPNNNYIRPSLSNNFHLEDSSVFTTEYPDHGKLPQGCLKVLITIHGFSFCPEKKQTNHTKTRLTGLSALLIRLLLII